MTAQILQHGKLTIRRFVEQRIVDRVLSVSSPASVNIVRELEQFLVQKQVPGLLAGEYAQKWSELSINELEIYLEDWDELGVPRPFQWLDQRTSCVTWAHAKYEEMVGAVPLSRSFVDIYEWLQKRDGVEFLVVAACYLAVCGAYPIIVTDGKDDGGVDLIGRIPHGPMRSLLVVVQSKTQGEGQITRNTISSEYGKYAVSCRNGTLNHYMHAAGLAGSRDGTSPVYVVISNQEYDYGAREMARELGILLRSGRQIADILAQVTDRFRLEEALDRMRPRLKRDLKHDISPYINDLVVGDGSRSRND